MSKMDPQPSSPTNTLSPENEHNVGTTTIVSVICNHTPAPPKWSLRGLYNRLPPISVLCLMNAIIVSVVLLIDIGVDAARAPATNCNYPFERIDSLCCQDNKTPIRPNLFNQVMKFTVCCIMAVIFLRSLESQRQSDVRHLVEWIEQTRKTPVLHLPQKVGQVAGLLSPNDATNALAAHYNTLAFLAFLWWLMFSAKITGDDDAPPTTMPCSSECYAHAMDGIDILCTTTWKRPERHKIIFNALIILFQFTSFVFGLRTFNIGKQSTIQGTMAVYLSTGDKNKEMIYNVITNGLTLGATFRTRTKTCRCCE